jgi:very-short-patch-repair endonuclease
VQSAYPYGKSDDRPLAELAAKQHSVVGTWQLVDLGYSHRVIHARVARGQLHRKYRGVYAVGHARLTVRGKWMAAVLACGRDALLSHRAAAALWELRTAPTGPLDVTATSRHNIPGIRCHYVRTIHPDDRAEIDCIPLTSLARTLLDQAVILSHQRMRTTLEAVERREILNFARLDALVARSNGHRGVGRLRAALNELHGHPLWTQSQLEILFLELIRSAGLPEPQVNVFLLGELVDFYWPEHKLVVEADGWGFHRSRRSFEENRLRDTKLQIAGIRVIRPTYKRIVHEPRALLADLTALLRLS